ncbi:MAG: M24 family metallopeptidase, partial [Bacilli bacterium]|nr:M24 family metallopeptidase [Bacilli bacterium]
MNNNIKIAQEYLINNNIDAWVIYDYECHNDALISFTGKKMLTRKVFMVIPKKDKPYIIAHKIDNAYLDVPELTKDFDIINYQTWNELISLLNKYIKKYSSVIMEMSIEGALPRSSYCDYGTIEMIKNMGVKVSSSSDLLISYTSTYEGKSLESQYKAMKITAEAKDKAFKYIEHCLRNNIDVYEYDVVKVITQHFKDHGLVYDSNPIVAINGNAGNPHYEPKENASSLIKKGDLILIDLWAKEDVDYGVYADITWMGYAGKKPPEKYVELFRILKESVDNGLD